MKKFNVTFSTDVVNNGRIDSAFAKKAAEDVAEKAYKIGKVEGAVLGGALIMGVYIVIDAVCNFLGTDDSKK